MRLLACAACAKRPTAHSFTLPLPNMQMGRAELLAFKACAIAPAASRCSPQSALLARSGTEALGTIAKDETIVVLVADINMPGLAGSAALAERARSFRPELAVILLTGGAADSRGFPLLRKLRSVRSAARHGRNDRIFLRVQLSTHTAQDLRSSSGSLDMLAAMRRASSFVSSFAAARRPGSSSK
jgi:CheY-like chemotaxis protein